MIFKKISQKSWFWFTLLVIIVFLFGVFGFLKTGECWLDAVYKTLTLFVLNLEKTPVENVWINWARFLAPVALVFGGIQTLLYLTSEGKEKLKYYFIIRSHTIICGMGLTGKTILNYLQFPYSMQKRRHPEGKYVLVDLDDRIVHNIAFTGNKCLICGDASAGEIIDRMKLGRARQMFILTGEDYINLKILHRVLNHLEERSDFLRIYIRIENPSVYQVLSDSLAGRKNETGRYDVRLINATSCALELFKGKYNILAESVKNFLILGCGSIGQGIVRTLLGESWEEDRCIRIMECSQDVLNTFNYNILKKIYKDREDWVKTCHCDVIVLNDEDVWRFMGGVVPDRIFVCLGGDWVNIRVAILMRQIYSDRNVKIVMVSAEVTLNEEAEDLFLLKELDIEVFRLQKNLAEALKLNNLMNGNEFGES